MDQFILVFTGCMSSGKTSALIHVAKMYTLQHKFSKTEGGGLIFFRPSIDTRELEPNQKANVIASRDGASFEGELLNSADKLYTYGRKYDVIACDELGLLWDDAKGYFEALKELFYEGKKIILSTLDFTSDNRPFPLYGVMVQCPEVYMVKFTAVCTFCGKGAARTMRLVEDTTTILPGGDEMYEPRCWRCHGRKKQAMTHKMPQEEKMLAI